MKPSNPTQARIHLLGHIALVIAMTFTLFFFDSKSLDALPQEQLVVMRVSSKPAPTGERAEIFFLVPWSLKTLQPIELIGQKASDKELSARHFLLSSLLLALYFYLVLLLVYRTLKPSLLGGSRKS